MENHSYNSNPQVKWYSDIRMQSKDALKYNLVKINKWTLKNHIETIT